MNFFRIFLLALFAFNSVHFVWSAYSGINEFSDSRAWLRLCKSGGGENLLGAEPGDRCPSGFWFKKSTKIGCACGHGVWVFAKGWCDRTARVIVAYNGSCFSVDKEVRYIRSIGYSNDAFAPYHFQTTVGFEYIQSLPGGFDYTYTNMKYDQHLGAIFRQNEIESVNSYNCLDRNDPAKRVIAMKYFTEKVPFQQTQECFKVARRNNTFLFDEGFDLNEYFVMKEKSKSAGLKSYVSQGSWKSNGDQCAKECVGNAPNATTATGANSTSTFPAEFIDPDTDYQNVTTIEFETPCNTSMQTYQLTSRTVREINEQTKRMILSNLASSMKRIVTPKVNTPDYLYLQMSRGVLEKVCPTEYIPHDLLIQLHRMFRVAVRESLRMYPFDMRGDANQTDRITAGLKACLDTARPFYMEPMTTTTPAPPGGNGTATNTTAPPTPASNNANTTSCPGEIGRVIFAYDDANTTTRTLFTGMPPDLVTDVNKLDLVTEVVWKTVMATHYYCARHFVANGSDFSSYYDKMEMFFNRWIQHRWYSPGLSPNAYAYALSTYDLTKFAKNLDLCVSASKSISSHRKWIKRPMSIRHCGGITFQELENSKKNAKSSILDAIRPQASTFTNGAYCLPYWHSPASNPGIDYDPAKDKVDGCISYTPEEWEDTLSPNVNSGWTNRL